MNTIDRDMIHLSGLGCLDMVKLLLDNGVNVRAEDNCALIWAARYGHTEIVKLLLEHGANVHAQDNYALRWATNNGHTETINLLKQYM